MENKNKNECAINKIRCKINYMLNYMLVINYWGREMGERRGYRIRGSLFIVFRLDRSQRNPDGDTDDDE